MIIIFWTVAWFFLSIVYCVIAFFPLSYIGFIKVDPYGREDFDSHVKTLLIMIISTLLSLATINPIVTYNWIITH